MKYYYLSLILLFHFASWSQSPSLSILVKMDSVKAAGTRYKIEMNICEPKKMSERGNWFTHDTSKIDFTSLNSNDITCGGWFDKGMPTLISGDEEETPLNQFQFNGQVFAWEKILVFKVSNPSSAGLMPDMYIVIPIKYKSFRTYIGITDIGFQPGQVIFLNDFKGVYCETDGVQRLSFNESLKNEKTVDVKTFPLKYLLK